MKRVVSFFRDFCPAIVFSIVVAFDCFIYEPITMYANNVDDFWFDFYTLISPELLFFVIAFVSLLVFFVIVKWFAKIIRHPAMYEIILSVCGAGFVCAYIHSNFLTSFLPSLDGEALDWSDFTANFVSIIVCIVVFGLLILGLIKFKAQRTTKYCMYVTVAIFVMLAVSFLSVMTTSGALRSKAVIPVATTKNLNLSSNDENYFIFLLDAVDSVDFNKIVESKNEYKIALKDFSYFPDTLSGYSFTRDSIPFIFSGEWNENKVSFPEYSTAAFDNSKFFARLSEKKYNKNFYGEGFVWNSEKALEFDNVISLGKRIKLKTLFKQELKYYLYKALPFPLKRFSRIEELNFAATQYHVQEDEVFDWQNIVFYNQYLKTPNQKTNQKVFQFIHLEGGHVPFNMNKDIEIIPVEDGTYEGKLEATMKIISAYLEYLKDNDAYDNANIVLLADHGYGGDNSVSRSNPILYVKGKFESHDEMLVSDKQISYADLADMFIELLDNKNSTEIFYDIPTSGRTRRYINNLFNREENMIEYEQTDKAWNTGALRPTGTEFNL